MGEVFIHHFEAAKDCSPRGIYIVDEEDMFPYELLHGAHIEDIVIVVAPPIDARFSGLGRGISAAIEGVHIDLSTQFGGHPDGYIFGLVICTTYSP